MLKNKVAIVTGGTRGIGLEIVKTFKKNGANVILFGSKEETVINAIEQLKKENMDVRGYYPNLDNYEEIKTVINEIYNLVNNAGISANKKIEDTTSSEFENIMNINVNSIFNVTKAVIPYMKKNQKGIILNTSSMVSFYGQPSGVGYPASKFAVNGITKSLARELAQFNIRVNAVAPGIINTDMLSSIPKEQIEPLIKPFR